jgi:hypothetical protein
LKTRFGGYQGYQKALLLSDEFVVREWKTRLYVMSEKVKLIEKVLSN